MITCEIKSIYRIICEILLRIFYKIRTYFGQQGESIPMSFVLGFYVSLVVKRWWEQYRLLPWPDTLALFISAAIPNSNGGVNVIIYQHTYIKTLVYSKKKQRKCSAVYLNKIHNSFQTRENWLYIQGQLSWDLEHYLLFKKVNLNLKSDKLKFCQLFLSDIKIQEPTLKKA